MNPQLLQLARARNQQGFITVFQSLYGNNPTLAATAYNAYVSAIQNNTASVPGSTTTNSGLPTNNSGTNNFVFDTLSKGWEKLNNVISGTASFIDKIYASQLGQETSVESFDSIKQLLGLVESKGLRPKELITGGLNTVMDQILNQLKQESELLNNVNSKTTLTGELSRQVREEMLESSIYAAKFGFTLSEISDLYIGLVEETGRFSLINKETMDMAAPMVRSFGTTMGDLARTLVQFEKVGIGANNTIETISEAGIKSMSLGLSGRKTVSDIEKTIAKLNEYGFQNGVKGLENMVRKSQEFRISIQETFNLAEKVMNPEGALDLSANLQVLGGAIGDLNDPLKLMYMATNNVEGLQSALIDAAAGLATYNTEQGRFEITGINLRRAREMATQLGVSYQELTNGAIAAAERMSANQALMSTGLKMDEEEKRFLTNLASMEGGEMVIKVPESISSKLGGVTKIALDKLDQNTANALLENKNAFEKLSTENIAQSQLTLVQQISRDVSVIASYSRVRAVQALGGLAGGVGIKDVLKDLRDKVGGTATDIINNRRSTQQGKILSDKVQNEVIEFKQEPLKKVGEATDKIIEKIGDKIGEKLDQIFSKNKTINVQFGPTPPIMDSVARDIYRNPQKWKIEYDNRDYLSTNNV